MEWRLARASDVPALARMNEMLLEDESNRLRLTRSELEERMRRFLAGVYSAAVFEEDATPVAYALWRTEDDRSIFLRQLWVARERRREGIGRRAFETLRREVFAPGVRVVLDVLVENARAIAFWRALGFVDYATTMELR